MYKNTTNTTQRFSLHQIIFSLRVSRPRLLLLSRILENSRKQKTRGRSEIPETERGSLLCARSMAAPIREVLRIFPNGVVAPSSSTLCCITLMILIQRNTISLGPSSSTVIDSPLSDHCGCMYCVYVCVFREHVRTHTCNLCSTYLH